MYILRYRRVGTTRWTLVRKLFKDSTAAAKFLGFKPNWISIGYAHWKTRTNVYYKSKRVVMEFIRVDVYDAALDLG